jgi:hypothetical protein
MRTSGGGGRDGWMTAIPIGLLVLFLVMASGGPTPFLRSVEATLRSFFEWVMGIV